MIDIAKKLRFILLVISVVAFFIVLALFKNTQATLPIIHGAIVPQRKDIDEFILQDHLGNVFSNKQLLGRWNLLSYGYTSCPDICPTTLHVLNGLKKKLKQVEHFSELQILFYSIDPKRDTVARLSQYMAFFDDEFIGLTGGESEPEKAQDFEKSLGIKAVLTPVAADEKNNDSEDYTVAHGVMLYLINPRGQLQAVLKPQLSEMGVQHFTSEQLMKDYIALREHYSVHEI